MHEEATMTCPFLSFPSHCAELDNSFNSIMALTHDYKSPSQPPGSLAHSVVTIAEGINPQQARYLQLSVYTWKHSIPCTFHTGWAKSRYTVINYILYTYFWPILYIRYLYNDTN